MKYWQAYIILFLIFSSKLFAQSNDANFNKKHHADSLFKQAKFYNAALIYEELSLTAISSIDKTSFIFLSAESYKQVGRYETAIQLLNESSIDLSDDSIIYHINYQSALNYYLNNNFESAQYHLDKIAYLVTDTSLIKKSFLLNVFLLNEQYKWAQAKDKLMQYANTCFTNEIDKKLVLNQLNLLYQANKFPKIKNVNKAVTYSTFFPGLGQAYTKNYAEGLASFSMVASTLALIGVGVYFQYYFTSALVGSIVLSKFHVGGVKRTEFLANKYNYETSSKYNNYLKTEIKKILN